MVEQTEAVVKQQQEIANLLPLLSDQLIRLGLVLTHQALADAINMIGYEMAALRTGTWPDSALDAIQHEPSWKERTK